MINYGCQYKDILFIFRISPSQKYQFLQQAEKLPGLSHLVSEQPKGQIRSAQWSMHKSLAQFIPTQFLLNEADPIWLGKGLDS